MKTKDWLKEGNDWFEKEDFSKALDCYENMKDRRCLGNKNKSKLSFCIPLGFHYLCHK